MQYFIHYLYLQNLRQYLGIGNARLIFVGLSRLQMVEESVSLKKCRCSRRAEYENVKKKSKKYIKCGNKWSCKIGLPP